MQTKSIIIASALSTIVSSAAINNPAMPTLGSANWYDWSSASVTAVAAASTTSVAVSSATSTASAWSWAPVYSSQWGAWSPVAAASTTTTPTYYTSTSSYKYENPFTVYLSQTNEWGVVTGMPAVVTSQPAVVTSQPVVVTSLPTTTYRVMQNTTVTTATLSSSFVQSKTASASIAVLTGGASSYNHINQAGLAVVGMVLGVAML